MTTVGTSLVQNVIPSPLSQWASSLDPSTLWTATCILGTLLLWIPLRSIINKWRLQRRQKKYPHIVVLDKAKKKNTSSSKPKWSIRGLFSRKNLERFVFHWLLPHLKSLVLSIFNFLLNPTLFVVAMVWFTGKNLLRWGFRVLQRGWDWCAAKRAELMAPKKEPKPPSVLRKPKSQRMKEAEEKKQPLERNYVQFSEHSTGHVRSQNYYYNPLVPAGNRVDVQPSQTPPMSRKKPSETITPPIEDPDEIAKRLTERTKIQHRIQTPPPKRRQKVRIVPPPGKENSEQPSMANANGNAMGMKDSKESQKHPTSILRQQSFNEKGSPQPPATPESAPAPAPKPKGTPPPVRHQVNKSETRSPKPFVYSSRKEPLSAQVRKRRLAGENLFSHSPQETSKSLVTTSSQPNTKRRRIIAAKAPNKSRYMGLPSVKRNNKREREEQILQEFNRKKEKKEENPPTTATPGTSGSSTPAFTFGSTSKDSSATTSSDQTTPAATGGDSKPKIVIGAASTDAPASGSTTPAPATGGQAPLVFGATDKKPAADTSTSGSGDKPALAFGAAPVSSDTPAPSSSTPAPAAQPITFGAAPAPKTGTANAPASSISDSKLPTFAFNAGGSANAAATPAAASTETDSKPPFTFGASTPAAQAPSTDFKLGGANNPAAPAASVESKPTFGGFGGGESTVNTPAAPSNDPKQSLNFGGASATNTPVAPASASNTNQGFSFGGASAATPAQSNETKPAISFGSVAPNSGTTSFSFGAASGAPKPDPPAADAPQPSFAFGSAAGNTPKPAVSFGATSFAPTPQQPAGGSFQSPPALNPNSTAGATPGFQAPAAPMATPGFQAPAAPIATPAGATPGFQAPAAPMATPATGGFGFGSSGGPAGGAASFGAGTAPPSSGASARRRSMKKSRRRQQA